MPSFEACDREWNESASKESRGTASGISYVYRILRSWLYLMTVDMESLLSDSEIVGISDDKQRVFVVCKFSGRHHGSKLGIDL